MTPRAGWPQSRSPAGARERGGCSQPHAATAVAAGFTLGDQLDARRLDGTDQLYERVDRSPDHTVARLHALDCGQGQPRCVREGALVNSEEGPCRP